ncbi:MAG TPA: glycerate-2-kinase family protein, partial [Acidimicrobiia bacterium]
MNTGEGRLIVEQIWRDAVVALDPAAAVAGALAGIDAPTHVLAAGKAAGAMSRGAASIFGVIPGLVISSEFDAHGAGVTHLIGDHPLPGSRSLEAGRRAAELCRTLATEHHLLVLISGGASALMELPIQGVTIGHIRDATELLMRAGADIAELNTVRAHLSVLKGGGLARLAAPATVTTLAISDVVGDPPHVIGSGPTVPNPTAPQQALEILDRYQVRDLTDPAVTAALQAGSHPGIDRVGEYRIVSNMAAAARSAVRAAESRG